jgi:hypothetical protein
MDIAQWNFEGDSTMFKIGINSAPRILPSEVTQANETPVQQNSEQQNIPEAKSISPANTSIRVETMFSGFAMRSQLMQQLAQNEAMNTNPASLKHITPLEQEPLTPSEAAQQIDQQPSIVKPFDPDEAVQGAFLTRTLYTGDGDDNVRIYTQNDGLVHVIVNGKDTWSGTQKDFSRLRIDTGAGNDSVQIWSVDDAKIDSGDGNDSVYTSHSSGGQIDTGDGNDVVESFNSNGQIDTGSGTDHVQLGGSDERGDRNLVNTGSGNDVVDVRNSFENKIDTGSGNDSVYLGHDRYTAYADYNQVNTGSGDDYVQIARGDSNIVLTGDGDDTIDLSSRTEKNEIDTGQGDDKVDDSGEYNRIK